MKNFITENWDTILSLIIQQQGLTEVAVNTWIRPFKVHEVTDDTVTFVLEPPLNDERAISFVKHKFYDLFIQEAIFELTGKHYSVDFMLQKDLKQAGQEPAPAPQKVKENHSISNLNPKYTFDTFVVGNNNKLAHAASVAVAEAPAESYNPLFLYGGVGLGKTHLMHSVAHYILEKNKDAKVLYVTSEKFTNELIDSIKHDKNQQFRDKYRSIDVLLIDDIQFIIGKESTQEEFFHTFNTLHEAKKQIIISSDKPPKDMVTLEERLRSRFEWGLTADIQPPDYETRMAILKKRAELDGLDIPDSVMEYVANNIKSNIRELEGALNKICVFANLTKKNEPITVSIAEEALKDLISPDAKREITPEMITEIVAGHYHVSMEDLISKKRNKETAYPRQIAMYLCRNLTDVPLQAIGKMLGKRDHSTVLHGCDKIEKDLINNPSLQNTIDVLIKKIDPSK